MSKRLTLSKPLKKNVVWEDRFGERHEIETMETRHLFYCLTMLWNNTMPVKTRSKYKEWELSDRFYDKEYLHTVVSAMWSTLKEREDLTFKQRMELETMQRYFQGDVLKIGRSKQESLNQFKKKLQKQ